MLLQRDAILVLHPMVLLTLNLFRISGKGQVCQVIIFFVWNDSPKLNKLPHSSQNHQDVSVIRVDSRDL